MRLPSAAAAVLLPLLAIGARAPGPDVQAVEIPTPRGPKLAAVLHLPAQPNGVAVVLAPGQGYHKELPLMKRGAEALAGAGITALRFDWAYFTAKGQPSEGYAQEREDLDAALAFVRARKDVRKVVLAGKSLGSIVALLRAGGKSDDLAGLVLLTLPVHAPGAPARPQVEAADLAKPVCPILVVNGDSDPMSDMAALYRLAAAAERAPRVVVVPGDHGYETVPKDHDSALPSVDLVAHALVRWSLRFAERAP